jgi:hypothetical protein
MDDRLLAVPDESALDRKGRGRKPARAFAGRSGRT